MITERTIRERGIASPDPKTLSKWRGMTFDNRHLAVRLQIAKWFGDDSRAEVFRWIDRTATRGPVFGFSDYSTAELECDVTTGLIREIEMFFGRGVADAVNSCL